MSATKDNDSNTKKKTLFLTSMSCESISEMITMILAFAYSLRTLSKVRITAAWTMRKALLVTKGVDGDIPMSCLMYANLVR